MIVESSVVSSVDDNETDAEASDREVSTVGTFACLTVCLDLARVYY